MLAGGDLRSCSGPAKQRQRLAGLGRGRDAPPSEGGRDPHAGLSSWELIGRVDGQGFNGRASCYHKVLYQQLLLSPS